MNFYVYINLWEHHLDGDVDIARTPEGYHQPLSNSYSPSCLKGNYYFDFYAHTRICHYLKFIDMGCKWGMLWCVLVSIGLLSLNIMSLSFNQVVAHHSRCFSLLYSTPSCDCALVVQM